MRHLDSLAYSGGKDTVTASRPVPPGAKAAKTKGERSRSLYDEPAQSADGTPLRREQLSELKALGYGGGVESEEAEVTELTFEEQSGLVVAGIPSAGFLETLGRRSSVAVRLFENALAGLYQRAEVDLVREQLEAELGEGTHYDISDEGLLVWPGVDYETELVGVGDEALEERLLAASQLESLEDRPPPNVVALERRARSDVERLQ